MAGVGPTVQVILEGWRDKSGRFAELTEDAVKRQQTVATEAMTKLRERARELSPRQDDEAHKRHKKYGEQVHFADDWQQTVNKTATGAEGSLFNRSPYANLVLFRTKPHPIDKNPGHLYFPWAKARNGFFRGHHVNHPGTTGHTEIAETLDRELARSTQANLQRAAVSVGVAFEGVFSRFPGRL